MTLLQRHITQNIEQEPEIIVKKHSALTVNVISDRIWYRNSYRSVIDARKIIFIR